jgi:hypothetical protein
MLLVYVLRECSRSKNREEKQPFHNKTPVKTININELPYLCKGENFECISHSKNVIARNPWRFSDEGVEKVEQSWLAALFRSEWSGVSLFAEWILRRRFGAVFRIRIELFFQRFDLSSGRFYFFKQLETVFFPVDLLIVFHERRNIYQESI